MPHVKQNRYCYNYYYHFLICSFPLVPVSSICSNSVILDHTQPSVTAVLFLRKQKSLSWTKERGHALNPKIETLQMNYACKAFVLKQEAKKTKSTKIGKQHFATGQVWSLASRVKTSVRGNNVLIRIANRERIHLITSILSLYLCGTQVTEYPKNLFFFTLEFIFHLSRHFEMIVGVNSSNYSHFPSSEQAVWWTQLPNKTKHKIRLESQGFTWILNISK